LHDEILNVRLLDFASTPPLAHSGIEVHERVQSAVPGGFIAGKFGLVARVVIGASMPNPHPQTDPKTSAK